MNAAVLERLRQYNHPREWQDIVDSFKVKPTEIVSGEPVYSFFNTLTDDLEVNPHSLSISVYPVTSFVPAHLHNYVEIIIPLQGAFTAQINGQKFTVEQDDILLVGQQTIHKIFPIDASSVVVNIALKDTAFTLNDLNYLRQDGSRTQNVSNMLFTLLANDQYGSQRYCLFRTDHDGKISYLVYDIISEFYNSDIQSEPIIRSDMLTLFSLLIRSAYHHAANITDSGKQGNNLLSFLLYIETNYRSVTLDDMAKHFGFHPNYLSSFLKKETGYTFIKLLHLQRINVAAEMLLYTRASVEQIATRVGYDNASYFYKIFKKMMAVSPNDYRKQNRHSKE